MIEKLMRKISAFPLLLLIFFAGCTVRKAIEAPEPTSFITKPERLVSPEHTPFTLAWLAGGIDGRQYDELVVRPVRTDFISKDDWIHSASAFIRGEDEYLKRVHELGAYLQQRLESTLAEKSEPEVSVITEEQHQPAQRALVLEISIAEANFGDPVIYGGMLAVPLPAVANLSTAVKSPSLVLEARLVDADTGEIVTELVDRRFPKIKIIDVNRLTVMSAVREMSDEFVDDFVKALYREPDEDIGRGLPFALLPW